MSKQAKATEKEIRVGVFGVKRGMNLSAAADLTGLKLVALCDFFEPKLKKAVETLGRHYLDLKTAARQRLGRLYNSAD